jgi:pimeloyl-ACP methyl ester carboxylesterase
MTLHRLSDGGSIYFLYNDPAATGMPTLVFFNPLTGDTGNWEAVVAPRLREKGFGTLSFDYRGQTNSHLSQETALDSALIVNDAVDLLDKISPEFPIFVGLSIGGLYAAQTWFAGAKAEKLVLINTLRRDGPRLKWVGDALVRAAEIGGLQLFRDLYLPLLMNEDWLEEHREAFLKNSDDYVALGPESGHYRLLAEAGPTADWDLPYEKLDLPTLIVTGLQDHVFLDLEVVDELYARLPRGERLDVSDAGHLIPSEYPEALADYIAEFALGQEVDS